MLLLLTDHRNMLYVDAFLALLAVLQCVVGWGLWRLRSWARVVTIVLAGLFAYPSLVAVTAAFAFLSGIERIIHIAFITSQGIAIAYLIWPKTKQVFEDGSSMSDPPVSVI